jgi:hypothetical protein
MFIIEKDIFLIILIQDVSKWYDKLYEDRKYKGNLHVRKSLHIEKLLSYYDPNRFRKCSNLCEERSKFLIEIQEIMDTMLDVEGDMIWMN